MRLVPPLAALVLAIGHACVPAKTLVYAVNVTTPDGGSFSDCFRLDGKASSPLSVDGYGGGLQSTWNMLGTDHGAFTAVSFPDGRYTIAFSGRVSQGKRQIEGDAVSDAPLSYHYTGTLVESCSLSLTGGAGWR